MDEVNLTEIAEEAIQHENGNGKKTKKGAEKRWTIRGDDYYLRDVGKQQPKLDVGVYSLQITQMGEFYLERMEDNFTFSYKIYGLESKLVDRVVKTFNATTGNMGILLNGQKGTGKTVTAKIMCNKLNIPVIVVERNIQGGHIFLNSIQQNVIIFIDEYEKVFGEASEMLTIMDGALNSEFRRMFVLTTNELYVNRNLLQRPGRIRYLKTFNDLTPAIIEEIIDDKLVQLHHKKVLIKFISALEIITVDIVKSLVEEVNIHDENPELFMDVFNVKKLAGKYDMAELVEHPKDKTKNKWEVRVKNVAVSPAPGNYLNEDTNDLVDSYVLVGATNIGTIVGILDNNTLVVEREMVDGGLKIKKPGGARKRAGSLILDGTKRKPKMERVVVKFEIAEVQHYNYYNYGF